MRALVYELVLGVVIVVGLPLIALELGRNAPLLLEPFQTGGLGLALAGGGLWLWAVWTLVRRGDGTPLPLDPPRRLVTSGPYRFLRNPMHLGLLAFLAGEALLFRSVVMLAIVAALAVALFAYSRWREETELQARFGPAYQRYRQAVGAWRPRWGAPVAPSPAPPVVEE